MCLFSNRSQIASKCDMNKKSDKCGYSQVMIILMPLIQYRSKVSWQSRLETRFSILEVFKNRESSFKARVSRIEFRGSRIENRVSRIEFQVVTKASTLFIVHCSRGEELVQWCQRAPFVTTYVARVQFSSWVEFVVDSCLALRVFLLVLQFLSLYKY